MSTLLYTKKSPCNTCPYRKDVPLQHWHKEEFRNLLSKEKDMIGATYGCHKKDGNVCVGWLMDQDKRHFPSIALRLDLSRKNVTREYLDTLHCRHELFESAEAMIKANYPELLK